MSLSFSSFGKILEKTQPIAVDEVINLNGHILPTIKKDKNKLQMFSFLRKNEGKQQSESFPFNAVSRRAKPTLCCLMPERSYEAKYTPKFEVVQCKSPSFDFGSGNQIRTRSISICSQDYYIDQYTSFRTMQKSPKAQTEKKNTISHIKEECPKLLHSLKVQLDKNRRSKTHNCSPDFNKYTDRKYTQREFLQQYDLLGVNYARINKRLDVGYVEFSKFTNKVMMKQDRAETPPSVRLEYNFDKPKQMRNIYLGNNKPLQPKLKPKQLQTLNNCGQRQIKRTQELMQWPDQ
ncbi:unnamed protein product (macronuclear) [Paramecium tetraurelia]|uniref:Uncharacterized protein n=1 Tax=Paramecium tetraurelia TaxID=5888 RepID=A0BCW2_PARTE|nr:uncharacterized protein GSPATT00004473001 [Paramecium tetraurelia]CAK56379.1 unnamed protein product [Paramecium tetraurelia]|eukprot:XP_001423777.1 hypothetical protein (macronuclear) [Paramecium tetraurelia strain d4-2]